MPDHAAPPALPPLAPQQLFDSLDQASLGLIWVDESATIRHSNHYFRQFSVAADYLHECFQDLSLERWQTLMRQDGPPELRQQTLLLQLTLAEGGQRSFELQFQSLPDAESKLTLMLLRPMDERIEREAVSALQHDVLEAVALGRPLPVVMDLLCRRVEALAPDVICSVLAVDEAGLLHPLAAPSLPSNFSAALDGLAIGPSVGSCGTAAFRGQAVQVTDIANDPLWADYRALALSFGLGACWSTPIFLNPQRVGATFALYYREARVAADFHRRMVEACEQLCTVALKHDEHLRQIERLAYFDGVTGLPNRTLFADRVRQGLPLAGRTGAPAALLLLDLDRFKTVNDTLGHASGDEVLRQAALRLSACLREADTLARFGGDEFVAWLPGCSASYAMQVAAKLLASLELPLELTGQDAPLLISASIGVSCYPDDGHELDKLLKHADIAMYEAKRAGRNCARFYLPAMNQALDTRMALESALRLALSSNSLALHYQPKVRLSDGALVGAEALLRWWHPQHGQVPPDTFIPMAEECGLVNALDAWVLEAACAQLASWREQGVAIQAVAVNVSPTRFQQDDVAAHVHSLLQKHDLRAEQITLEMTERLLLEHETRTVDQLNQLHSMGVRLSIDDFGTGYSSLSYLKRLPVSELKLDKSFVRDLETDADDRALSSAVIGIGRALGLAVVAEGVETEGQRRVLIEAGCEIAQGYFFARPQSAQDLQAWLKLR
ncbi:putative bifunctional diguanylate cyclase/phosphodiesterase [Roseateles albus]|uniref:EAL domain-containing protein n=1 Tax=Roseateles albus TaxID=2987525 RepID=A0ABT5KBN6_9BURK|nr:EAL domain-containing protein [Roseateles albus]MDC8770849.1 EAL domain-containing protein [Roseateles albus]